MLTFDLICQAGSDGNRDVVRDPWNEGRRLFERMAGIALYSEREAAIFSTPTRGGSARRPELRVVGSLSLRNLMEMRIELLRVAHL